MTKPLFDPEECKYRLNTLYEITINPSDQHQFFTDKDRLNKCYNRTVGLIRSLNIKDIEIYTEISEKNNGMVSKEKAKHVIPYNRIHFHGTLKFLTNNELIEFLLQGWVSLVKFGSIQISPYRKEYWTKYINKQQWLIPTGLNYIHPKSDFHEPPLNFFPHI